MTLAGVLAAVDPDDVHTVNITYPAAFREGYLRPEVRLEIGPLASWVPSAEREIRPYAADLFPASFAEPVCTVVAIDAERYRALRGAGHADAGRFGGF